MKNKKVAELIQRTFSIPADERQAFLSALFQSNPELKGEIVAELSSVFSFQTGGALQLQSDLADSLNEALMPGSFADYKVESLIGSGGFADVYRAVQLSPVERPVALKILKTVNLADDSVAARFDVEKQTLAQLNHPHIATIFDAGESSEGRPYIAMELVEGLPITQFVDERCETTTEVLEIFLRVCAAVQHAHQRGVIHRDLKPSNVLVVERQGKPWPMVIDFGIAKVTGDNAPGVNELTRRGDRVGTPLYMSPEQLLAKDVDTRSDIYSLGLLLFRLLTGALPFETDEGNSDIAAMIRYAEGKADIPKPSLSQSGSSKQSWRINSDLDWIVIQALASDRERRYGTIQSFAEDLQNLLHNRPVKASSPSVADRLVKFTQRNWLPVTALAAVMMSLVSTLVYTNIQRLRAEESAARLASTVKFQSNILEGVDPHKMGLQIRSDVVSGAQGLGGQFADTLSSLNFTDIATAAVDANFLDPASSVLSSEFANQPDVASALSASLGRAYSSLGDFDRAVEMYRQALEFMGSDRASLEGMKVVGDIADALNWGGSLQEAVDHYRERYEWMATNLAPTDPLLVVATGDFAKGLMSIGELDDAENYAKQAVSYAEQSFGKDDLRYVAAIKDYATMLHHKGELSETRQLEEEVLAKREALLDEYHDDVIVSHIAVGSVNHHLGNLEKGDYHLRQAHQRRVVSLGALHPKTLSLLNRIALVNIDQGRLDEAERLLREAIAGYENVGDSRSPNELAAHNSLGNLLSRLQRHEESLATHRFVRQQVSELLGSDHPFALVSLANVGSALKELGRMDEARPAYDEAYAGYRRTWGDSHSNVARLEVNMAGMHISTNELEQAQSLLDRAEVSFSELLEGENHTDFARLRFEKGRLALKQKDFDQAARELEAAEEISATLNNAQVLEQVKQAQSELLAVAAR